MRNITEGTWFMGVRWIGACMTLLLINLDWGAKRNLISSSSLFLYYNQNGRSKSHRTPPRLSSIVLTTFRI